MGANRDHHKHEETDWSSVGFLRLCCYATTYTGGPPLTETRQLELPSLLDLPRGILPSLQTLLSKTKKKQKAKKGTPPTTPKDSVPLHRGYPVARGSVSSVRPNLSLGSHDSVIQRVNRPCSPPQPPSRDCFNTRTPLTLPYVESRGPPHLVASTRLCRGVHRYVV